jgi:hypothetical protein
LIALVQMPSLTVRPFAAVDHESDEERYSALNILRSKRMAVTIWATKWSRCHLVVVR